MSFVEFGNLQTTPVCYRRLCRGFGSAIQKVHYSEGPLFRRSKANTRKGTRLAV